MSAHAGDAEAAMKYIERERPAAVVVPHDVTAEPVAWISRARDAVPDALIIVTGPSRDLALLDAGADILLGPLEEAALERVLFMTAGFVPDRAQQFLARIPGQWIYKPFDLQRLRAALIRLFD